MIKDNIETLLQDIKKDFYRYRNGMVAGIMKKYSPSGKLIYGLNVPQFLEMSKNYPHDMELGLKLWENKNCRESRLFALYILPTEQLSKDQARDMFLDVETSEEAEFLAFRILRKLPFAKELFTELSLEPSLSKYPAYCLLMFEKNLNQR